MNVCDDGRRTRAAFRFRIGLVSHGMRMLMLRPVVVIGLLGFSVVNGACSSCTGGPGGEGEGEGGEGEGGEGEGEGIVRVTCTNAPAVTPGADVCAVTAGTGGVVVVGEVLLPGQIIDGGGVTIEDDGTISCVGCDCVDSAGGKAVVVCPDAVVSPGLINSHDHAGWMNDVPWVATADSPPIDPALRWEQRNDWRKGARGNPKIHVGGGANGQAKALGELRFVLGGATTTNASGGFKGPAGDGSDGFLRNADDSGDMGAIGAGFVDYQTFPLNDSGGLQLESGCIYKRNADGTPTPPLVPSPGVTFTPHISEGIDQSAHNEFQCLSSTTLENSADVINEKTAIIHAIGLLPADVALMAQRG